MASIHKEIHVRARPDQVWSAVRDIGALHTRFVPGFVVDTKLEPGARVVTFGNGMVVREAIVDIDETDFRLVWSASGGRLSHHNASVQVFPASGDRTRIVWIADLLPDEMRGPIEGMIDQGMAVMKTTLEALASSSRAA